MEDMNRKGILIILIDSDVLSLSEEISQGSPETNEPMPLSESKGWLQRFKNEFGWKTIKMPGEAVFANEEVATTSPKELKKLRRNYTLK